MEKSSNYPLTQSNSYARSDTEAIEKELKEVRNKKRMKYLLYFIAFVIFQTGVIVLMTFTIMKIRTPTFIVRSASLQTSSVSTDSSNPTFNMTMNIELGVENTNFGTFNYDTTTIYLSYINFPVGHVYVPKSSAGWRSTKKINVIANLIISPVNSTLLTPYFKSGIFLITTQSTLNGKVKLVQIFKKKKSIKLDCSLEVNASSHQVTDIQCNT